MPKGYEIFSTFSPEQQRAFSQLIQALTQRPTAVSEAPAFQGGERFISDIFGGDTEAFEAPLMRQFQEQILPSIAERFSGLGSGAQRSSAFQQALGQSGADLTERLAALRGQLKLGALGPALSYAQAPGQQLMDLLGMETQQLVPKSLGFGKQLALGLTGGLSSGLGALGSLFGGKKLGIF